MKPGAELPVGDVIAVPPELKDAEDGVLPRPPSSRDSTGCSESGTRLGSEEEESFRENTSSSLCTNTLMLHPPGACAAVRRSAYALPSASLTFRDLTYSLPAPVRYKSQLSSLCIRRSRSAEDDPEKLAQLPPPKLILAPCSGHFQSGELVAIMGPSGCGKTTLLDMLAGKKSGKYGGEVFVNGRPRGKLFGRIAAYVGQEDVLPPHWTVREAIEFNATLKRQPKRAHCSSSGWTDTLLGAFDLQSVSKSRIGSTEARGISGGQRRRTSLARGVATCPSLLFCDELTSGLSATDAETCVKALRIVTKRLGLSCFVVIHQPRYEVASLFDKLLLLTSNPGRMAYLGSMSGADASFRSCDFPVPANINPTDYYLDLVTPNTLSDQSDALVRAFDEQIKPQLRIEVDLAMQEPGQTVPEMLAEGGIPHCTGLYAVRFQTQLAILLRRKLLLATRNPAALGLPIIAPICQGCIIGYMFCGVGQKDDLLKQIMFSFCLLTMLCLAGTLTLIVLITERNLMKHEVSEALYCEGASALASFLIDVPLSLSGAFLEVTIMAAFAQIEVDCLGTVLGWALLLFFFFDSLFAFIAAIARDTRQAQVLSMPFVSLFMLFNGFIVSKAATPMPLHWIFWISPNAYAMQAITVRFAEHYPVTGPLILKNFGYSDDSNGTGIAVLCTMIILLRIGQQIALRCLNGIRR